VPEYGFGDPKSYNIVKVPYVDLYIVPRMVLSVVVLNVSIMRSHRRSLTINVMSDTLPGNDSLSSVW